MFLFINLTFYFFSINISNIFINKKIIDNKFEK